MERAVTNSVSEQRANANVTQEALAQVIGVSRQTIIAIEKGKYTPSVALALRIAGYFGVLVEDIFRVKN